jgi:hypothetical protein
LLQVIVWSKPNVLPLRAPEQYEEGMNLYEYGESDPMNYVDPAGRACKVFYKCALVGERIFSRCFKHCDYQCIEDKSKKRKEYAVGGAPCDDPMIPETVLHSYPTLKCKKCDWRAAKTEYYMYLYFDWRDCSKKECSANAKKQGKRMRKMCVIFKSPERKLACKMFASSIEVFMESLCDLCKD